MNDLATLILERAVEDYTGLWELLPLTDVTRPSKGLQPPSELIESVRDLLAHGLVAVYLGNWFDGDQKIVMTNPEETLSNIAYWRPPEGNTEHVRIAATTAGESAYYGR